MNFQQMLKDRGFRVTTARQATLSTLADRPLSASEIHEQLQSQNVSIDLASVYRSLELFVDLGLVHAIHLGEDRKRYELVDADNHHHHLVCNSCGSIEDIALQQESFLEEVQRVSTFKVDHHHLEFFGTCQSCQ